MSTQPVAQSLNPVNSFQLKQESCGDTEARRSGRRNGKDQLRDDLKKFTAEESNHGKHQEG
jgi:hypothetical protein